MAIGYDFEIVSPIHGECNLFFRGASCARITAASISAQPRYSCALSRSCRITAPASTEKTLSSENSSEGIVGSAASFSERICSV